MSSIKTLKKIIVGLWEEFGKVAMIILGCLILLYICMGVYRVSQGESFWRSSPKPETREERIDRLFQCAQASAENSNFYQQWNSDDAGACAGFKKKEIKEAQEALGI